jgi:uncharacterized protein YpmS
VLNVEKTSFIIFSNRNKNLNFPIVIRNNPIERVTNAKFLGVIIDEMLSFSPQVVSVNNKISKVSGVMRRLSYFVPVCILRSIYFSLLYPHLIYGVPAKLTYPN